tara:strand:- start:954 stop:1529 length:576 start_codon:yes stop_codon:yes gene_type:complete
MSKKIRKPYYAVHRINTGKYTIGNEFITNDGSDYVGTYHILPNKQIFTGEHPTQDTVELFLKRHDVSEVIKRYNRLTNNTVSKYISPVAYQPRPTLDEYADGFITRYFVQKRTRPSVDNILEIDAQQYNSINTNNVAGINGVTWSHVIMDWKISILSSDSVHQLNSREIQRYVNHFNGIEIYLYNTLEYYK